MKRKLKYLLVLVITIICLTGCGEIQVASLDKLFNNKIAKFVNILSLVIVLITVIGRLLSGVHWFTDIIGGIFIGGALLMTLYSVLDVVKKN